MKYFRYLIPFITLAILFSVTACGKKAPPFIKKKDFSLQVVQLKGAWEDGQIILNGTVKGEMEEEGEVRRIKGAKVYYARYPATDPPCPTCPIKYHGYHEFGSEIIKGDRFSCKIQGKGDGRIFFIKVYLIGKGGELGPASERIQLTID